ncbi:MAG: hypothetical protein Q9P01_10530 [Anaerolineae bacterium]|nr:hypothetical protein [Anaerolineae bacterium]
MPAVCGGHMIADLIGIIGSFDFTLGDADR